MIDLSFGHSRCVREAFLNTYNQYPVSFNKKKLMEFDYPSHHEGDLELIEITKQIIKRQIGLNYKYVLITNGATGGVVISLRAYNYSGYLYCLTRNAPFYTRYPGMISASGLTQVQERNNIPNNSTVILLDAPSNPIGLITPIDNNGQKAPVILDGVYLNHVYMPWKIISIPQHDVFVGSYSKLLGINSIRVGFIALNDDFLYERIKHLVISEYCSLSMASTHILKSTLINFNWEQFETSANVKLDNNREEFAKLEYLFGNTPTSSMGMFQYVPMDSKCQEIISKAGIIWTKGATMGTDDSFGRFNLGASNQEVKKAVLSILKMDGR